MMTMKSSAILSETSKWSRNNMIWRQLMEILWKNGNISMKFQRIYTD